MSAHSSVGTGPRLLLLAPLVVEAAAVRSRVPGALLMRTGMGRRHAQEAARRAARTPAGAVAVVGLCGALVPELRPGDIVVPDEILDEHGRRLPCSAAPLVAALRALGMEGVHVGALLSTEKLGRAGGRDRTAATGAIAVDMEAAWLAAAAAGRPFAVLRVVVDTPTRSLRRPIATVSGGIRALRVLRRAAPALERWAGGAGGPDVLSADPPKERNRCW